jgi:glycosyltransferase involved in cell wall biosynthesis
MMKIWIPSIRTGSGSDVYIERLAQSLSEQGVTVQVQWFPHYFELCPYLLRLVRPPANTDLIFANSWSAVGFIHHPIPVITCIHHCVHDPDYRPFKSWPQDVYHRLLIYPFEAKGLAGSRAIVTGSKSTQQVSSRVFKIKPPHLICYAIDTETFKPATIKIKQQPPYKLLFIGNQSIRKGFDLLPQIMWQLGSGFKLYFTTGLRNIALATDIPQSECVGALSTAELVQLYQECDALLFPTRYEGFGYAVAEAMACGLPVVASDCASIPELLEEGKGGFLCPVDDVDSFVQKIRLLQAYPELGQTMGEYNRLQAVKKFSPDRMAQEYMALFQQVLSKP